MKQFLKKILEENQIEDIPFTLSEKDISTYSIQDYLYYLENVLSSYQFTEDMRECLVILPIISYLMVATEIRVRTKINIYEELKKIRGQLQKLILQKPGEVSKSSPNFLLLKKIINQTESLLIAEFYDMVPNYQGDSLKLMEYLLFEVKKDHLIEDIFRQYPYMIRLVDENGEKLIQKLIFHYLEEIENYTKNKELKANPDLVYYDKVLNLFFQQEKLEFDFQERVEALGLVNKCRKNMIQANFNDVTKRKYIFWINLLEERLKGEKHDVTFSEVCYMHDIPVKFDEGILSEARRWNKEIKTSRYPERTTVTDYVVTIDGENAEEIDDGLSIRKLEDGTYRLGIHIADPTSLLPKDNIILEEAFKRTTSIYLKTPIYMYPEVLVKDKMNFIEGKPRLATSYYLEISPEGKIENYEFLETIIYAHNMTYSEADEILKKGSCKSKKCLNTLIGLKEVTSVLAKNFSIDEVYQLVNRTKSNVSQTNIITNSGASKIVETCMVIANYIVAYHMKKNHLPCINRIHVMDEEYLKKLSQIKENLHSKDEQQVKGAIHYLESFYPEAIYSTEEKEHFGLGLPIYTHVTAPLRRGIDNIMKLYVLNPFYFYPVADNCAYQIEDQLKYFCQYFNERSQIIRSFMDYQKEIPKVLTKN